MKKFLVLGAAVILLMTTSATAQWERFSIGFLGSQFGNYQHDQRISEIKNPQGYGVVLGYQIRRDVAVGITEEYAEGAMERWQGTEKDYRTNASVFIFPFATQYVRPYLSAGVVYTHRHQDYIGVGMLSKDMFNGRLGAGLDYPIFDRIGMNGDLGLYNDGWKFVGWSGTFGLRCAL
jgi:opacity protein-like surface antigen